MRRNATGAQGRGPDAGSRTDDAADPGAEPPSCLSFPDSERRRITPRAASPPSRLAIALILAKSAAVLSAGAFRLVERRGRGRLRQPSAYSTATARASLRIAGAHAHGASAEGPLSAAWEGSPPPLPCRPGSLAAFPQVARCRRVRSPPKPRLTPPEPQLTPPRSQKTGLCGPSRACAALDSSQAVANSSQTADRGRPAGRADRRPYEPPRPCPRAARLEAGRGRGKAPFPPGNRGWSPCCPAAPLPPGGSERPGTPSGGRPRLRNAGRGAPDPPTPRIRAVFATFLRVGHAAPGAHAPRAGHPPRACSRHPAHVCFLASCSSGRQSRR